MSCFSWIGPLYERDCGGNGMLSPGEKEEEEEEGGRSKLLGIWRPWMIPEGGTSSEVELTEAVWRLREGPNYHGALAFDKNKQKKSFRPVKSRPVRLLQQRRWHLPDSLCSSDEWAPSAAVSLFCHLRNSSSSSYNPRAINKHFPTQLILFYQRRLR